MSWGRSSEHSSPVTGGVEVSKSHRAHSGKGQRLRRVQVRQKWAGLSKDGRDEAYCHRSTQEAEARGS